MSYSPYSNLAIDELSGDVTAFGPGNATATVNDVGGEPASTIATSALRVSSATSAATPSTLVLRDISGNISGTLTGHSTLDLALSGGTMSGNINMGNESITNLAAAVNPTDAVNYAQAQSIALLNALIFG